MPTAQTAKLARAQEARYEANKSRVPDCARSFVTQINKDHTAIRIIPIRCRQWACPFCAPVKLRELQMKARRGHPQRHIVLTMRPRPGQTLPEQIKFIARSFNKLVERIRKLYGTFEYMRVLELHKTGHPHLHILCRSDYIPQRWLQQNWRAITGAWNVHISKVQSTMAAVHELTKYFAKTVANTATRAPGTTIATTSNGYFLDDEQTSPEHAEKDWINYFCPIPLSSVASALEHIGSGLDPHPDAPGMFTIRPSPPPDQSTIDAMYDMDSPWSASAVAWALTLIGGAPQVYADLEMRNDARETRYANN